jgi:Taurine catabolism dioxygenase TauD, TfdA family
MSDTFDQPSWHWTAQELRNTDTWLINLDSFLSHNLKNSLGIRCSDQETSCGDHSSDRMSHMYVDAVMAEDLNSRLINGPGFAVITGRDLADASDEHLRSFMLAVSCQLGTLRPQDRRGSEIKDIRQIPVNKGHSRGFDSSDRMLMHSDPTDFAGLMCLRPSINGGESTFCSSSALYALLRETYSNLMPFWHRTWTWDLENVRHESASRTYRGPIFCFQENIVSCRFGSHFLKSGLQFDSSADGQCLAALETFEKAATDPTLLFKYKLSRGDSLWLNNQRVLHGRRAYFREGPNDERHLLRTWVSASSLSSADPTHCAFEDHIFGPLNSATRR